jgi:hypothetical protein
VRTDLPADVNRPLTYNELLAALRTITGESVEATLAGAGRRSRFVAAGRLHDTRRARTPTVAIGEHFTMVLDEQDFVAGHLHTLDGNATFALRLRFASVELSIAPSAAR